MSDQAHKCNLFHKKWEERRIRNLECEAWKIVFSSLSRAAQTLWASKLKKIF